MPAINVGSFDMYYEVLGEGFPVVLLHCMPLDHHIWFYQNSVLSRYFQVITPDLRSHGKSGKPHEKCEVKDLARDVKVLVDELGLKKAILCGLSLGGIVVQQYILDYPQDVRGAIISGTIHTHKRAPDKSTQRVWKRNLAGYNKPKKYALQHFERHVRSQFSNGFESTPLGNYLISVFLEGKKTLDPEAIVRILQGVGKFDATELLESVRTPVLVIAANKDGNYKTTREIHELIPNSKFVEVDGGHASCVEYPEQFNPPVLRFCRSLVG